jgi:hypothetical protein
MRPIITILKITLFAIQTALRGLHLSQIYSCHLVGQPASMGYDTQNESPTVAS